MEGATHKTDALGLEERVELVPSMLSSVTFTASSTCATSYCVELFALKTMNSTHEVPQSVLVDWLVTRRFQYNKRIHRRSDASARDDDIQG